MSVLAAYESARRDERVARLRRVLALRGLVVGGSQREIAERLGISQPAVSQQLKATALADEADPLLLLEAAAPVLTALAAERGYGRLAVFGSVARGSASADSDIDLLVESPPGTSSLDFLRFKRLLEEVLGRGIDLVDYGGLKPDLDDDILREAVPL